MSRNGSGTMVGLSNSWSPPVAGQLATAGDWQAIYADLIAALTQSLSRDGQGGMLGNLPMGGNKITGLGDGTGSGQALTFSQLFDQGTEADLASAATTDIGVQLTNFLRITGTTTITSFGTNYKGPRFLRFAGAVTLTNSATLALPGGADITTAAGDCLIVIPTATLGTADGWRVIAYQKNTTPGTVVISDGSVTTAKIADGAITTAKFSASAKSPLAGAADIATTVPDSSITPAKLTQKLTLGTSVGSTSGTSIDFTSIPSWVKRVTVMFSNVSANGSSVPIVQLGTSGGVVTSGYVSASGFGGSAGQFTTATNGFALLASATSTAANFFSGSIVITNLASGTWVEQCGFYASASGIQCNGGGSVNIGGTLDRLRITTAGGTDVFDLGAINILYE